MRLKDLVKDNKPRNNPNLYNAVDKCSHGEVGQLVAAQAEKLDSAKDRKAFYKGLVNSYIEFAKGSSYYNEKYKRVFTRAACVSGNEELIDVILDNHWYLHSKDSDGCMSFHLACANHHVGVASRIIESGVDINIEWDKDLYWRRSVRMENVPVVKLLLENMINPFAKGKEEKFEELKELLLPAGRSGDRFTLYKARLEEIEKGDEKVRSFINENVEERIQRILSADKIASLILTGMIEHDLRARRVEQSVQDILDAPPEHRKAIMKTVLRENSALRGLLKNVIDSQNDTPATKPVADKSGKGKTVDLQAISAQDGLPLSRGTYQKLEVFSKELEEFRQQHEGQDLTLTEQEKRIVKSYGEVMVESVGKQFEAARAGHVIDVEEPLAERVSLQALDKAADRLLAKGERDGHEISEDHLSKHGNKRFAAMQKTLQQVLDARSHSFKALSPDQQRTFEDNLAESLSALFRKTRAKDEPGRISIKKNDHAKLQGLVDGAFEAAKGELRGGSITSGRTGG